MSLLVVKFGGTSVGSVAAIESLATITREQRAIWDQVVVVVSAMSGVTDLLIKSAHAAAAGDRTLHLAIARQLRERSAAALAELVGVPDTAGAQIERLIDEFELLSP